MKNSYEGEETLEQFKREQFLKHCSRRLSIDIKRIDFSEAELKVLAELMADPKEYEKLKTYLADRVSIGNPKARDTHVAKVTELEDDLLKTGFMNTPPCFICGYNGPGYYDPRVHSCAERHHKLFSDKTWSGIK